MNANLAFIHKPDYGIALPISRTLGMTSIEKVPGLTLPDTRCKAKLESDRHNDD